MMKRQRTTQTEAIRSDLRADLDLLKALLDGAVEGKVIEPDGAIMEAFAGIETFCAIAVRVIAHTNPSVVRDIARTVEIQSLMVPS